jgi:hypothetical protein
VTLLGQPTLDLGDDLATTGAPDTLLDGSGFVTAIRHRFGRGVGFVTEATFAVEGPP